MWRRTTSGPTPIPSLDEIVAMNVNVPSRLSTFVDLPEGSAKRRSLGVSWRGYCINDGAVYTLGRDTSDSMAVYGDHHHTVRLLQ